MSRVLIARKSVVWGAMVAILVSLALTVHGLHRDLYESYGADQLPLYAETLPDERYARFQWLNFRELAGDYYWLRAVSHFGDERAGEADYPLLLKLLRLVTTIKPNFATAYQFAGIALPMVDEYVDGAIDILAQGVRVFPKNWQLLHLKGYIHFIEKGEYVEAARLYAQAALVPGVPSWVPGLAQRLSVEGGKPEVGLELTNQLIADTNDEKLLKHLEKRRLLLMMEIRMRELQKEVNDFHMTHGVFPKSLGELDGVVGDSEKLADGAGGYFQLSQDGKVITSSEESRLKPFYIPKKNKINDEVR